MSFDVFLQRFQDGEPPDDPRQAVRAVLRQSTYNGPDEFGFYIVSFSDGTDVEFSASGLELDKPFTSCAFHIRGFGDDLIQFMFDIARAGDMVMIPTMEGNLLIFVSEQQKAHVPGGLLDESQPIVVDSPAELRDILTGGFAGWSSFRDQVFASKERLPETQRFVRGWQRIPVVIIILVVFVIAYFLWNR